MSSVWNILKRFGQGGWSERICEPDTSVYKTSELEILGYVKNFFKKHTTKAIRDFSHNERGYKETNVGEVISYKYAENLQI